VNIERYRCGNRGSVNVRQRPQPAQQTIGKQPCGGGVKISPRQVVRRQEHALGTETRAGLLRLLKALEKQACGNQDDQREGDLRRH
jgi:hypothetical protein